MLSSVDSDKYLSSYHSALESSPEADGLNMLNLLTYFDNVYVNTSSQEETKSSKWNLC